VTRLVFRNFDEFADAISGVAGRFVPTARCQKDWWLQTVQAGDISSQLLQIGSPATFAGNGTTNAITLGLPLTAALSIRIDGRPLDKNDFVLVAHDRPFTFACSESVKWVGITVPLDCNLLDPELPGVSNSIEIRSAPLRHLKQFLSHTFSADLKGVLEGDARRWVGREIAAAVSDTLKISSNLQPESLGRPKVSREHVIAKVLELIRAHSGQPLFVDDLCRCAGVGERTLRRTFEEYFGVGPMRLLKVRQLYEIRAALLAANPRVDTVTQLAARFGIWDFSLFARNYKNLFGESPSQTLRQSGAAPGAHPFDLSWLACVSRKFVVALPPSNEKQPATSVRSKVKRQARSNRGRAARRSPLRTRCQLSLDDIVRG
jgi:AraC family ethanolamine operon transcriptional activator